jgi:hypothetical protein
MAERPLVGRDFDYYRKDPKVNNAPYVDTKLIFSF